MQQRHCVRVTIQKQAGLKLPSHRPLARTFYLSFTPAASTNVTTLRGGTEIVSVSLRFFPAARFAWADVV
jgi:hypothetical protein